MACYSTSIPVGSITLIHRIVRSEYTVQQNVGCCDWLHTCPGRNQTKLSKLQDCAASLACSHIHPACYSTADECIDNLLSALVQNISRPKNCKQRHNSHLKYSLLFVSCSGAVAFHLAEGYSRYSRQQCATPAFVLCAISKTFLACDPSQNGFCNSTQTVARVFLQAYTCTGQGAAQ
jgi:hypothetical protein